MLSNTLVNSHLRASWFISVTLVGGIPTGCQFYGVADWLTFVRFYWISHVYFSRETFDRPLILTESDPSITMWYALTSVIYVGLNWFFPSLPQHEILEKIISTTSCKLGWSPPNINIIIVIENNILNFLVVSYFRYIISIFPPLSLAKFNFITYGWFSLSDRNSEKVNSCNDFNWCRLMRDNWVYELMYELKRKKMISE